MKIVVLGSGLLFATVTAVDLRSDEKKVPAVLQFKMKSLGGEMVALSKYQGKVVLIVNVASDCGLTPQYEPMQALHAKFGKHGLAVLGFPCNQFGQQEPGTAKEIREFCTSNYKVTFDLFDKVEVNGDGTCDLFKHLTMLNTKPKGPGKVDWNFEKFLIGRSGAVIGRFESNTAPDAPEIVTLIEAELAKK